MFVLKYNKHMRQIYFILLLFLFSCANKDLIEEKNIVCTTSIIYDVTKNIVPENFKVTSLMGPGVDPHLYKSKSNDYQLFKKASTLINNGLHLEGRLTEVFEHLQKEKTVLSLSDGITKDKLIMVTVTENVYDPHIWMDMDLMKAGVVHLSKSLQKQYSDEKVIIDSLSVNYINKLEETSNYIDSLFELIEVDKRILITAHDAFSYFGKRNH
jgi:manganese/zinc/iron transport system substrate-binding protein